MNKLNFALIGCGRIAPKHAEAITKNERANLLAVCDVIDKRARDFANCYGVKIYYTDYHQILERADVDVVNICTPSGLHAQIGIDAAWAGKNVVVEKPMALSLKDADALIKACEDNKVTLTVCHQNRFNPAVRKLREALESGRFGKLTHASAVIRWFRPQEYYEQAKWRGTWEMDGGCLMNQSIHNIDLLQWMIGPVESVFGYTATNLRKIEAEDVGVAVLRFKNGALGTIEASTTIYPENLEETLNIFGEKGTAILGGIAVNRIEKWKFADLLEKTCPIFEHEDQINDIYGNGHYALINNTIQTIYKETDKSVIDGYEGRKALEIILAIYHSVKCGKEILIPLVEEFAISNQ